MSRNGLARSILLLISITIALGAIALVLPSEIETITLRGKAKVNQAPAVRIQLASPQSQTQEMETAEKPDPKPEPEPEPEPKPEPELEPEPVPEPKIEPRPKETENRSNVAESETSSEDITENTADRKNVSQQVELMAGNSADVDSYLTRLGSHLSRFYEYPRRARRLGQEGAPVLVFEFSREGALLRQSLRSSSGHSLLDDAALEMLKDAEPLPAVPASMTGKTFTYALPVRFSLR